MPRTRRTRNLSRAIARRRSIAVLALALAAGLVAGCGNADDGSAAPSTESSAPGAPPLPVAALDGMMLDDNEVNAAIGRTDMLVANGTSHETSDSSRGLSDQGCLFAAGPLEEKIYAGSGWTAIRSQFVLGADPGTSPFVTQGVVLFPSAHDAAEFFTASTKSWPTCSDRSYTVKQLGSSDDWTMGQISNTDGTLSGTKTRQDSSHTSCGRALTVRNNVAVDTQTCGVDQNAKQAVDIAQKIAAKVPTK